MDISERLSLQQLISDAERQGTALAKGVQHLIFEDETTFLKFVDGLYLLRGRKQDLQKISRSSWADSGIPSMQ